MADSPTPDEMPQAQAGKHIRAGIVRAVGESIRRQTPYLSAHAANELIEDVGENVLAFFREVYKL